MAAAAAAAVFFAVALAAAAALNVAAALDAAAALAAAAPVAAAALLAAAVALFKAAALMAALDAAASAAAAFMAAAEVRVGAAAGGGESLPLAGNCPPTVPPSWLLLTLGLRADLAPTSLSAAAKSWPLPAGFTESAADPPPIWVRSGVFGASETTGVAFIPRGVSN
jgi:hypothetical protein